MKINKQGNILISIIILIFLIFWLVLTIITKSIKPTENTIISFSSLYSCKDNVGLLVQEDQFSIDDYVYLCFSVDSNKQDLHEQVILYIFKDKFKMDRQYYYYDYFELTNQTTVIPVKTIFEPGEYFYTFLFGKLTLGSGSFTIDDN